MKINHETANLIFELEHIIGYECYNPKSYNGWTGEEGCSYRYPVCIQKHSDDEYITKTCGILTDYTVDPEQVHTMKYRFGSNHLYIGNGLIRSLEMLEKRYHLDFAKLEEEYQAKRRSR